MLEFLLHLFLFVLVLGIFIALFCFLTSPYTMRKIDVAHDTALTHATTGARVDLNYTGVPYALKPSLQTAQLDLLRFFVNTLREQNIRCWAVKTTLLASVRHARLIPWEDHLSLAILHDELPMLVKLRTKLEHGGTALLKAGKHGYLYCANNIAQFPCIDIDLMKQREHEVNVCTPTDELGGCSFQDSFLRRREVFSTEMVFPLRPAKIDTIDILVPRRAEECLDILYNKQWQTAPLWSNWKFFIHTTSRGYARRMLPASLDLF